MNFSVYVPSKAEHEKVPVLFWLSGLTCTEKNFIEKSGFQHYAEEHGIMVVGPDTSPRGCNIEGEEDSWDFGTGAGFYCDSTQPKWKDNYRMYSYVTEELPNLIKQEFPASEKMSIFGHSMGGHGALICFLKNPGKYCSVSAFAPICNPMECPWGRKALTGYLGTDKSLWEEYDATCLMKNYSGPKTSLLIDQGAEDKFLQDGQLQPENLAAVCKSKGVHLDLRMQEGYDHSYYFISTFIGDHFAYHAKFLKS